MSSSSGPVQVERRGKVAVLWVDNPPVNALSHAVRSGLVAALEAASADPACAALVVACRGRTFIAGADIHEFGKPPVPPRLVEVIERFDACAKPVLAAVHGTALGGGLELALGCNYRVFSATAKCGLPEVKLGILPGAGGTQRLPRLIGFERALELVTTGETIDAHAAQQLGIADELVAGDVVDGAVAFAERVASARPLPRARDLPSPSFDRTRLEELRRAIVRRARGAEAPGRCVEALTAALDLPFEAGLAKEGELMAQARDSAEARALRHVFFAEREASKIPGLPPIEEKGELLPIRRVAVLGAGTMGSGIATVFANAGLAVVLLDREPAFVDKGLAAIRKTYDGAVAKGRMVRAEAESRLARVRGTTSWDDIADADLVIEAVFEDMALKRDIFAKLSAVCRPDAILATNTSTLNVDEIARSTPRPEQVLGLHFFSPANVMRLLEIVRADKTSSRVLATCVKLAKQLGKVSVVVGVCYGFVGNRMLHQYYREAQFLLQEGASPAQLDMVMSQFGFAMGPCATSDLAGIDVGWRIRKGQPKPPSGQRYYGAILDRLAELGRFGQKTRAGFYKYGEDGRTPSPDPEVDAIILQVSQELGVARRAISNAEILERCMLALISEGAYILQEGIAARASDIDTVWINGYGFPPHRGGPMHYADSLGLANVHAKLLNLEQEQGAVWKPAALLERLAREGSTFAAYDQRAR